MDQNINILIGWQAYVVCFVLENTDVVVLYCIHIASCQIDASTASAAAAKNKTTATAKITGILWRAVAKATGAPSAALFGVCCRSIEHISKMLSLRDSVGNHPLLLSLK